MLYYSDENSEKYTRLKIGLSITHLVLELVLLGIGAFTISKPLYQVLSNIVHNEFLLLISFIIAFGGLLYLILLPLDFYQSFIVEHKFNLSNQSFSDWVINEVKEICVGSIIGLPLLLICYYCIKFFTLWWLYLAIVVIIFAVVLAKIAPVIIFPLFYTFTPIENDELKKAIENMLCKYGITIQGIYRFNLSKDTKKANAAFTGLGKTKRILLSDTLLNEFTIDEILIVFAHELGHFVKKHIVQNIVISGFVILFSFYACSHIYEKTYLSMGFHSRYDIAALPILLFYLSIVSILLMPILNTISRYFETQADIYALEITKNPTAFISVMEKLSRMNLAAKTQHPVIEFLLYSHPSIAKRIALAQNYRMRVS